MQRFSSISVCHCLKKKCVKIIFLFYSWKQIDKGFFSKIIPISIVAFGRMHKESTFFLVLCIFVNTIFWPNYRKFQIYRDAREVVINVKKMLTYSKDYSRWFINIKKIAAACVLQTSRARISLHFSFLSYLRGSMDLRARVSPLNASFFPFFLSLCYRKMNSIRLSQNTAHEGDDDRLIIVEE